MKQINCIFVNLGHVKLNELKEEINCSDDIVIHDEIIKINMRATDIDVSDIIKNNTDNYNGIMLSDPDVIIFTTNDLDFKEL